MPQATLIEGFDQVEERLVGRWFARLGAMAVVVGAGSAFAYAVERGWIGPAARLLAALTLGVTGILLADRIRERGWSAPAQALAGGGTALLYLSMWAASVLYGFLPLGAGLVLLSVVVLLGALLALRHDSEALAVLSLLGGFLNPYTTGALNGPEVLAYVLVLDLGVVGLTARKPWTYLLRVATLGSWTVAFASGPERVGWRLAWTSGIFLIFAARPLMAAARVRRTTPPEASAIVANAFLFLAYEELVLAGEFDAARGGAAFGLAATYLLLWLLARTRAPGDLLLGRTLQGLSIAIAAVAVPIQWHGSIVGTLWSASGVAFLWAGMGAEGRDLRVFGVVLVGLGLVRSIGIDLEFGAAYLPHRLLLSQQSLAVAVQLAAVASAAVLLGRPNAGRWEQTVGGAALLVAHLIAVGWASVEARAYLVQHLNGAEMERAVTFAFSAIWASYAACVFAAGLTLKRPGLRLTGISLFGLTLFKMMVDDVWLLSAGQRAVVFAGVGTLLIGCSLAYHRFREILMGRRFTRQRP